MRFFSSTVNRRTAGAIAWAPCRAAPDPRRARDYEPSKYPPRGFGPALPSGTNDPHPVISIVQKITANINPKRLGAVQYDFNATALLAEIIEVPG